MLAPLLVVLASLHSPSFVGTLSFGPDHALTLHRSSEGYLGTLGALPVEGRVTSDGVLHLSSGKRAVGEVRRSAEGFELTVEGASMMTTALLPTVAARGPKLPTVMVPLLPGASIGEVRLGQTVNDLSKLGAVRPHPSGQFGDAVQVLGPYTITLTNGRVSAIELTPSESELGLVLPWLPVMPGATAEAVAKAAKGCSAPQQDEGGTTVVCDGLLLKEAPGCGAREASGVCTRWDGKPSLSLQVVAASRK